MRPWHATITLFDAAGAIGSEWVYRFTANGAYWEQTGRDGMSLSEMLAALAQLAHASPRMRRMRVRDWETPDGPHYPAPSWMLSVEREPLPGMTPEERLWDVLALGLKPWACWDFPDEVGLITCDHWEETMAMIDYLVSKADAPQRVAA
jgi:hypothetical protein